MINFFRPRRAPWLRWVFITLAVVIVFQFVLVVSRPTPAQAFPGEALAAAVWTEIKAQLREIRTDLRSKALQALKVTSDIAFKNSLRVFTGKLAEDTATWIATGGTGQQPLFVSDTRYFQNLVDSAAGDFVDTYAQRFFGTSLCQPPPEKLNLLLGITANLTLPNANNVCQRQCAAESQSRQSDIQLINESLLRAQNERNTNATAEVGCPVRLGSRAGPTPIPADFDYDRNGSLDMEARECADILQVVYDNARQTDSQTLQNCNRQCTSGRRQAECTFTTIRENIQTLDTLTVSTQASLYLSPENNDIGQLLRVYSESTLRQQQAAQQARDAATLGFLPTTNITGDQITAPFSAVAQRFGLALDNATRAETTYTGSIAADTIRIFTSTLISRLTERIFKGKCGLNPAACGATGAPSGLGLATLSNTQAARLQFARLGQIDYIAGDSTRTQDIFETMRSRGLTVDARLVQAINEKKTVKEALDAGLLDGAKTFGFDLQGNEPQDGYPYRLLVYLRHYRVVPVGWELAALYLRNFERQDIGLSQLVRLFNEKKVITENSITREVPSTPFYGLIDPNWVLKAPANFCKRQGAGEEVLSRQFVCDENNNARTQGGTPNDNEQPNCGPGGNDLGRWVLARNDNYCTDEQSCIAENDDGTCRQYGYCFAEKTVWRFNGTSCPNYAASCVAFANSEGADANYLTNTTNGTNCSADNAGCRWFCADPNGPNEAGNWSCTASSPVNKLYMDRDAETCNPSAAGCTEFLTLKNGANLLRNSSFETVNGTVDDTTPDGFPGWSSNGNTPWAITSDNQNVGGANATAARLFSATASNTFGTRLTGLHLSDVSVAGRNFTFSVYARTDGGTCQTPLSLDIGGSVTTGNAAVTSTWQRFTLVGVPPAVSTVPTVTVEIGVPQEASPGVACDIIVDNAQLEESSAVSAYKDYGSGNQVFLNANRVSCLPNEVGCEQYTPRSGGAAVNGVVNAVNRCAANEVGCQAWREMPITTVPTRPAVDPVNFIASTGQQCSAAAVGCEEYTNLDEQAAGGEALRYYTQIKQCVRPDPSNANQQTFFSWVGSESQGFELRSFRLLRSNAAGPDGTGPCTSLSVSANASTPPACNDTASTIAAASCSAADLGSNPDCTEFFDIDGNLTYRLRSRTINVTESCFRARNTNDQADPATRDQLYSISDEESAKCGSAEKNCREYKGNTGNNARTVYEANFEGGSTADWLGGAISTESVTPNGHSMQVANYAQLRSSVLQPLVATGKSYVITFWAKASTPNAHVEQLFFTNGSANPTDLLFFQRPPGIALSAEWNQYSLGPVFFGRAPGTTETLDLYISNGSNGAGTAFIDNIQLREFSDSLYMIKGSAQSCTAAAVGCQAYTDRSNLEHYLTGFTRLCTPDKVGCQEVINTYNSSSPTSTTIKGVTTLADEVQLWVVNGQNQCAAEDKGCTELGQATLNSDNAIIGWQTVYRKQNPDRYVQILCTANEDRCAEFTSKVDGTKFFFRDPGPRTCSYERPAQLALCSDARTPCNPNGVLPAGCGSCTLQNNSEFHWMVTGTDELCPSQGLVDPCSSRVINGQPYFCHRSQSDAECQVNQCITRTCEAAQSGCTEYRDPTDPAPCRIDCPLEFIGGKPLTVDNTCRPLAANDGGVPGCQSYYYLRQSVQGTAADCGTTVDVAGGCRPFLDTSNPARSFRGN